MLSCAEQAVNHPKPTCQHCKQEIQPDQSRWTAHEPVEYWHYTCAEAVGLASGERFRAVIAARSNPR